MYNASIIESDSQVIAGQNEQYVRSRINIVERIISYKSFYAIDMMDTLKSSIISMKINM